MVVVCGTLDKIKASPTALPPQYQAAVLFECVRNAAMLRPTDILLDLFCGAGAIGLCLADAVAQVVGMDVDVEAIATARKTAEVNHVHNASFYVGDLSTDTTTLLGTKRLEHVDVVVLGMLAAVV